MYLTYLLLIVALIAPTAISTQQSDNQPDGLKIALLESQYIRYEDLSEVQAYRAVMGDGSVFELKIDPTDRTLLRIHDVAYLISDHEVMQQIEGTWYTFRYWSQPNCTDPPCYSLHLPFVGK